MRIAAILALLCTLTSLILSFLVLFAGHTRSFLPSTSILTLNVSRLGHSSLDIFNTSSSSDDGFFANLTNSVESYLENEFNDLATSAGADLAQALNLSDFYSVHVMGFCQGEYTPNASVAAEGKSVGRNVTECTGSKGLFHFNASAVVAEHLPDGITLDDIHWPQAVTDAEKSVRAASIAMEVLYILACAFVGLAFLGTLWTVFSGGRLAGIVTLLLEVLGFVCIGGASAVATAVGVIATHALNKKEVREIGVSATKGTRFLAMTWAATALMLVALVATIVAFISSLRARRHGGKMSRREVREAKKHGGGY